MRVGVGLQPECFESIEVGPHAAGHSDRLERDGSAVGKVDSGQRVVRDLQCANRFVDNGDLHRGKRLELFVSEGDPLAEQGDVLAPVVK